VRPLRLELEGFATFRGRTVLDFDQLDLVAFVGPTGAGKSTIIDAMTFALYGSVARYDNANVVAPVIHQLSNEAKVRFDFEVAGHHFVAVRVVRRRGLKSRSGGGEAGSNQSPMASASGASTKEARLERFDDGASVEVLAGNVRELDAAVNQLIGLDFSQFTRTVVLPQGQFAQFLKDEPASRQRLLRDLLELGVYARMGSAAREAAKKSAQQAEALEQELNRQPPVTDNEITELTGHVDLLTSFRTAVEKALGQLDDLDLELGPLRAQVETIDQQLQRLTSVTLPDGLVDSDMRVKEATDALAEAESALETCRTIWEAAQKALESLPERSRLDEILGHAESVDGERARLIGAETDHRQKFAGLEDLEKAQETARAELDVAQADLALARAEAAAGAWVAKLVEGEPCPVCQQTVHDVPDCPRDDSVTQAEKRAKSARTRFDAAATKRSAGQGAVDAADSEVGRLRDLTAGLEAKLDGIDVDQVRKQQEERSGTEARSRQLLEQLRQAENRRSESQRRRDRLVDGTKKAASEMMAQRDVVADLKPPPQGQESVLADWTVLVSWAEELGETLGRQREALARRGKDLARERADLLEELAQSVGPAGVDTDPKVVLESLAVARSEAAGRLEATRSRQADQQRLRRQVDELGADHELNTVLGRHLSASGFEGWLLNEALDNMVTRATDWLRDLSGGSYSLAVAGREFAIIDHNNADEWRDVRTLSGGETFLASLSLALALADSIAELAPVDAPRLESMFLDEGFGTLDAATLDVVAAAIEELASTGRMIGIVTHVRDLAERMPARFEVSKTPVGSAVELVEL
jgi:exonuclease SbcC